MILKAMLAVA